MKARILVVDDDASILRVVSVTLSRAGHEVFTAQSGREALEQVNEIRPDLIILDANLPSMDGYQVCRRLRGRPASAHLPIMMLTAHDTLEPRIECFEAGTDDFMVKPFHPTELEARVQALLRRARAFAQEQVTQIESKVIAVFSLRGGVGVSTLATNLALGLMQIWNLPTTLVDLACACGQSALMLNLALRHTWFDLARIPREEFTPDLVDQVLLSHPTGLRVLATPPSSELEETITAELVSMVLQSLTERNHYLVFDLPHHFHGTTLEALDRAHQILVMMAPEMASVHATRHALEVFDHLGYDPGNISLFLNWTFERRGLARKDIENALGRRVNFVIPFASEVLIEAINLGAPPVLDSPDSPISALFHDISFYLSKKEHQSQQPAEPTPAWKRVIQRRQRRRRRK